MASRDHTCTTFTTENCQAITRTAEYVKNIQNHYVMNNKTELEQFLHQSQLISKDICQDFESYESVHRNLVKLSKLLYENRKRFTFPVSMPYSNELINKIESLRENDSRLTLFKEAQRVHERAKSKQIEFFPRFIGHTGDTIDALVSNTMRINSFSQRIDAKVKSNAKILTFGSCFANHMHRKLHDLCYNSTSIGLNDSINNPVYHAKGIAGDYAYSRKLKRYTSVNDNEITEDSVIYGSASKHDTVWHHLRKIDGEWTSNYMCDFYAILKKEINKADLIIFTIGSAYLQLGKRYRFCKVEEMVEGIQKFVDYAASTNKQKIIILTLSPIPLSGIWGGMQRKEMSAIESDCFSKSTGRVAIQEFLNAWEENKYNHISVDYFPSFEMVRWLAPWLSERTWEDPIHVNPSIIDSITNRFIAMYFKQPW